MRRKLTKKLVEAIVPEGRDIVFWDSEVPGFGLKVTPAGKRIYLVYYRATNGQQRRPKIGEHGIMTVDEARQIARQWLAKAAIGEDVSAERQLQRNAETVVELCTRYLRDYAEAHKKPSSVASDRANIENHVIPFLGKLAIREVTRGDIERFKIAIRDGATARKLPAKPRGRRHVRGGQGVANRVMALLSKMFNCAVEWELCETNPAQGVRKFKKYRKDRFLDSDEVGRLIAQLEFAETAQIEPITVIVAIRILLFTGMRYGEVMGLKWRDIDQEHGCFRLPDSKTGKRVIPFGTHVRMSGMITPST